MKYYGRSDKQIKNATVNGVSYTLTTAPRIVTVDADGGGRTMVPLRFIAEAIRL